MNSFVLAILSGLLYLIAYHSYGRFLARKLFQINPTKACPSETEQDGIDFVPTPRSVLFDITSPRLLEPDLLWVLLLRSYGVGYPRYSGFLLVPSLWVLFMILAP